MGRGLGAGQAVQIDRIGTRTLDEGTVSFSITDVTAGGVPVTSKEPVTDHFARGQFMELSEQQKLEGRSFETFTSGVRVGTTAYAVGGTGTTVVADYEVDILEPQERLNLFWEIAVKLHERLDLDVAVQLAPYGAAGQSARAKSGRLVAEVGKAAITEPPMAVVDPVTMVQAASVLVGPTSSEAVAAQMAVSSGSLVVEAYEMAVTP